MRWLSAQGTRLSQPQGAARVDWGNPIARGLEFVGVGTRGGLLLAKGGPQSVAVAPSRAGRSGVGPYVSSPGGTTPICQTGATGVTGSDYSLFAFGTLPSAATVRAAIDDDLDTGSPRCFQFRVNAGKVELITFNTGGTPYFATGATLTAAQLAAGVAMAAVVAGNQIASFANGRKTSATASGTQRVPTGNFYVGQHKGTGANGWDGELVLVGTWSRALSDAEVASLSANPWQLFAAERRIWVPVVAGGGGPPALAGSNCTQANTSSTGAIVQRHVLTGAGSTQANASTSAAIVQRHVLAGAPTSQANASATGAAAQRHTLAAAGSAQPNSATAGAGAQRHLLAGANSTQPNTCSTGAIGSAGVLVGAPSSQANSSSAGAITQRHKLTGAGSAQANSSSGGAVVQRHALAAAGASQANTSQANAVATRHILQAAPSVQDNIASASAIVQRHILAAANCAQANASSTGGANAVAQPAPGGRHMAIAPDDRHFVICTDPRHLTVPAP